MTAVTEVTEQEIANHQHVGSGEVETENAPAPATETAAPAPAAAPAKKKSTAVNLVGTRYENFVTDGRFLPGHDAKAKSAMIADAISDDPEKVAHAEQILEKMNWTHFLTTKREALTTAANKPKTPAGERPLTGAALKARQKKEAAANGGEASTTSAVPAGPAAQSTPLPGDSEIWLRQSRRGIFVMRGQEAIGKKEGLDEAQALGQETFDAAIAAGQTVTYNPEPQS